MGNYEQLKQSVSDVIKTNGNQEITGSILQNVLLTIISTVGANSTFAGIATPATNPGTPDGPVFYIASESGTYSNFGSVELQDGLSVLMWNGSWNSQQIFGIDDVPTAGSDNLVKSGGVQEELALGAVYDVSAKNPTAGPNNDGKFESLSALLGNANLDTLIPISARKGGMSIKFVQSYDNKYVQYRLMTNTFSTTISDWRDLDSEITDLGQKVNKLNTAKFLIDGGIISEFVNGKTYDMSVAIGTTIDLTPINNALNSCLCIRGIKKNTKFKIYVSGSGTSTKAYAWLNSNQELLSTAGGNFSSGKEIIAPEDNCILLLDNTSQENPNPKVETSGYINTSLENLKTIDGSILRQIYGRTVEHTEFINNAFFDLSYSVGTKLSGIPQEDAQLSCYKITGLSEGAKLTLKVSGNGNSAQAYAWLDNDNVLLYKYKGNFSSTYKDIICPAGATILLVNNNNDECPSPFIKIKSVTNDNDEDIAALTNNVTEISKSIDFIKGNTISEFVSSRTYDMSVAIGTVIDLTPTYNAANSCLCITNIPKDTRFDIYVSGNGTATQAYAWLNSNQELLSKSIGNFGTTGKIITSPEDNCILLLDNTNAENPNPKVVIYGAIEKLNEQIAEHDYHNINLVYAAKKNYIGGSDYQTTDTINYLQTIVHITDIHNDYTRTNRAFNLAKKINASVVCSGDITNTSYDNIDVYKKQVAEFVSNGGKYIHCVGNHDVWSLGTADLAYNKYYKSFIEEMGLGWNMGISDDYPYPTCFYFDDSDFKIRYISIDQWRPYSNGSTAHYNSVYNQLQIDFVIEKLKEVATSSSLSDYGVIIVIHSAEAAPRPTEGFTKFWSKTKTRQGGTNIAPITKIVDAFISKESINETLSSDNESINVIADFSESINNEFICYMSGHSHTDDITYASGCVNKQLLLQETCTTAIYSKNITNSMTESSDLGRTSSGLCQDAFNVYVIDRRNKNVKVVRIGADMPYDFSEKRDCMIIPYVVS